MKDPRPRHGDASFDDIHGWFALIRRIKRFFANIVPDVRKWR